MIAEDLEFVQQVECENIEVLYLWNIGGIEVKGYNLENKLVEVCFEYDDVKFLVRSVRKPTYSESFLEIIRSLIAGNYSDDMATVIKVAKKVGKPVLITSGIYKNSREFTVRLKFPVDHGYSILFMEFDKIDLDTLYGVRFSYVLKDENFKVKRGDLNNTRKVFDYMHKLMFD